MATQVAEHGGFSSSHSTSNFSFKILQTTFICVIMTRVGVL